jgi:hypothetical protein
MSKLTGQLCTVEGCDKPGRNRGMCSMHYERWRKTGTTDSQRPTTEQRFWSKVDTSAGPDACWPWTGTLHRATGYGLFLPTGQRKYARAHRFMYELTHPNELGGKQVDHICINRICVNPAHLRLATKKQNMENRLGAQRNSTTGARGVTRLASGKFRAQVQHNGANHYRGTFATIGEAAEAARLLRCGLFTHNDVDRQTG